LPLEGYRDPYEAVSLPIVSGACAKEPLQVGYLGGVGDFLEALADEGMDRGWVHVRLWCEILFLIN